MTETTKPATTVSTHHLGQILRQVTPHMAEDHDPSLNVVRLEADEQQLLAVASDRYTFGVSRTRLEEPGPAWEQTISADAAKALRAWIKAHGHTSATVRIISDGQTLTFNSTSLGTLSLNTETSAFPKWRGLFLKVLRAEPASALFSSWSTDILARWTKAGYQVGAWQPEDNKPMLVTCGPDFIGLQMPMAWKSRTEEKPNPASVAKQWAKTLGDGPSTDPASTFPPEPRNYDVPKKVPNIIEGLLQQTIHATNNMFHAPSSDPGAMASYAAAGGNAWMAYRFLEALQRTDPNLAHEVAQDVAEQLDSGEIGEWAWEAAKTAGHDPDQWVKDWERRRDERKASQAADAAAKQQAEATA